jgi:uncharacterized membrane protein (UPF0127 family)
VTPRAAGRPVGLRVGAALLAVVAVVLLAIGIARLTDDNSGGGATGGSGSRSAASRRSGLEAAVRAATPAAAPFRGLTHTRIVVGTKTLDVVIANSELERETGLRRRSDVGGYGGMLFVFPAPTTTAFTMSTVPVSLDIGFYDASGAVVDRLVMRPCTGTDETCPAYQAKAGFSYALETVVGGLPPGPLAGPA